MKKKYTKGCFCTNEKVSFQEHLEPLLECGKKFYGVNQAKGLVCQGAGLEPARWSEFEKGKKKFTAYYAYNILVSLQLTPDQYEKITGIAFSPEQINELKVQKFVYNYREFIDDLVALDSPEIIDVFKKVVKNPERFELLRKLFSD